MGAVLARRPQSTGAAPAASRLRITAPLEIPGGGSLVNKAVEAGLGPFVHKLVMMITGHNILDRIRLDALKGYFDFGVCIALNDLGLPARGRPPGLLLRQSVTSG